MDYIEADNSNRLNKRIQYFLDRFIYSPLFGIKLKNNLDDLLVKKKFKVIEQDKFSLNSIFFYNF